MVYIALLRGINVGGKTRVEMARLKQAFEDLGFSNVSTYINSGNVLFAADVPQQTLVPLIEEAIEQAFGFRVPIVVRTAENIIELARQLPATWKNDQETRTDIMFLWPDIDNASILDNVVIKTGIDHVLQLPGALVWHVCRADINKSGMLKLVGTKIYKQMTIRNSNTLHKLASLAQSMTEV